MSRTQSLRLLAAACAALLVGCLLAPAPVAARQRTEYRAFWVDTFNTALNNHADVVAVVNNAKAAKANAIFAQVRRRGDSWYLNSLEPKGDRVPIAPGFDPLQDLISEAHANGIEVHAFVIMSAIWGRAPNLFPPENPNHAFNLHGGFDPATNTVVPGPNNWLTRTLLPDAPATPGITYQGHRFGSDFWIDFGHPDAAAYTVDVLKHLVASYDIDGLHLDRIRYPEFSIAAGQPAQTPTNGTNIGYNTTSVARFNARHGRTGNPATGDLLWSNWRRDQVTNVVRRVYLETLAIKPHLKVSAALIAFGGGPTTEAAWNNAEARWRVYQDWRAWTEEGIVDIAIPMVYKAEHTAAQVTQFNQWNEWTKNHQYNRGAMMGLGGLNNSVEGTLRQTRRSLLAPSTQGKTDLGVIYFSMATSNIAVTNNPLAIPPGTTPARPFSEFASGLTTGKSVDGSRSYEDQALNPEPVFAQPAAIPVLPWKAQPTVGHLKGFARRADSTPLDTATVTIEKLDDGSARQTATDGGGFYGGVDLAPGQYLVRAALGADTLYSCVATVTAGSVTTADLGPETTAPTTSATFSPAAPDGANGWYRTDVQVALDAADNCSGVAATEYSLDGGATWLPYSGAISVTQEGVTNILFRSADRAGNVEAAKSVAVKLDKTAPSLGLSADPTSVWPPNGRIVNVTLSGQGSDAVSGLASVTYAVTDEYGAPLAVPARALAGASASWADALAVEASRRGDDRDGRLYRITATLTDEAGHTATAVVDVVISHDQRRN
ncbi:MAG TPA: family 10 glycosylhydrolase [Pyrinomonadaceae bacterium]|nr:family 10 glycosylhydrolase [Pyrinomonadaceae bacterium]